MKRVSEKRLVRIKQNAFNQGGMRRAFFFEDKVRSLCNSALPIAYRRFLCAEYTRPTARFVAKASFDMEENTESDLLEDVYSQIVAKEFASKFMVCDLC